MFAILRNVLQLGEVVYNVFTNSPTTKEQTLEKRQGTNLKRHPYEGQPLEQFSLNEDYERRTETKVPDNKDLAGRGLGAGIDLSFERERSTRINRPKNELTVKKKQGPSEDTEANIGTTEESSVSCDLYNNFECMGQKIVLMQSKSEEQQAAVTTLEIDYDDVLTSAFEELVNADNEEQLKQDQEQDGRPICNGMCSIDKDVIDFSINQIKKQVHMTASANTCQEMIEQFISNIIPTMNKNKDGMMVLKLTTNNPARIMDKCLEHTAKMFSKLPKLINLLETQLFVDNKDDSVGLKHKRVKNLSRYGNILILHTRSADDAEKFLQDIRTGGASLCYFVKKSRLTTCFDSFCQAIEMPPISYEVYLNRVNEFTLHEMNNVREVKQSGHLMVKNTNYNNEQRHGTEQEEKNMQTICSMLNGGFPHVLVDEPKKRLLEKMSLFFKQCINKDCIFVTISSHGELGSLHSVDNLKISFDELLDLFALVDSKTLIFCLMVCCQYWGKNSRSELPSFNFDRIKRKNTVIISPIPGSPNIRDTMLGSWTISELMNIMPGSHFFNQHLIHKYSSCISINDLCYELCKLMCGKKMVAEGEVFEMALAKVLDTTEIEYRLPVQQALGVASV